MGPLNPGSAIPCSLRAISAIRTCIKLRCAEAACARKRSRSSSLSTDNTGSAGGCARPPEVPRSEDVAAGRGGGGGFVTGGPLGLVRRGRESEGDLARGGGGGRRGDGDPRPGRRRALARGDGKRTAPPRACERDLDLLALRGDRRCDADLSRRLERDLPRRLFGEGDRESRDELSDSSRANLIPRLSFFNPTSASSSVNSSRTKPSNLAFCTTDVGCLVGISLGSKAL
mmetsp:Transcript_56672/g.124275  ORF Transcript_56672/g.124275 Transcript_56672/m.124275 type:complete len:229 (-) Transcript_56672:121-807(-)